MISIAPIWPDLWRYRYWKNRPNRSPEDETSERLSQHHPIEDPAKRVFCDEFWMSWVVSQSDTPLAFVLGDNDGVTDLVSRETHDLGSLIFCLPTRHDEQTSVLCLPPSCFLNHGCISVAPNPTLWRLMGASTRALSMDKRDSGSGALRRTSEMWPW